MFLPSTIFGHVALHCNHVFSSPDENNNIKKAYNLHMHGAGYFVCHMHILLVSVTVYCASDV